MNANELREKMGQLLGDGNIYWGLDFGSYRSIVSYKERDKKPETARYKDECLGGVPSEYWLAADGTEYVGDEVIREDGWIKDPEGQCASVKMKLKNEKVFLHGSPVNVYDIALKLAKRIISVSSNVLYDGDGIKFAPRSIVMGAPARFDGPTRRTLELIWMEALGIGEKKIKIVSEPILAAIAINQFEGKDNKKPKLAYDMGHGTFDIAMLRPNTNPTPMNPEPFIAENPDGLEIAGGFLDEIMVDLIMDNLRANPGLIKLSVLENKNHPDRRRLLITARELKEKLSKTDSAPAIIAGVECGYQMVEIKRAEYEERIRPHIKKMVDMAYECFVKSGFKPGDDIDILLVGGSTYIPLIEKMLKEKFSWLSEDSFSNSLRERAVALGAAIYAESVADGGIAVVAPKIAYGYAVETYSTKLEKSVLDVQIPSNADLPQTIQGMYYTRFDDQERVVFNVYEVMHGEVNELLPLDNGTQTQYFVTHEFGKKVPKKTRIELKTTLSRDGILTMKVDDMGITAEPTVKVFSLANIVLEEK